MRIDLNQGGPARTRARAMRKKPASCRSAAARYRRIRQIKTTEGILDAEALSRDHGLKLIRTYTGAIRPLDHRRCTFSGAASLWLSSMPLNSGYWAR